MWIKAEPAEEGPRRDVLEMLSQLGAADPPDGPEDGEVIRTLRTMVADLDRLALSLQGLDYLLALHARSVARSHLIRGYGSPREAGEEADLAAADALEAFASLRDLAFRGDAGAKSLLAGSVQRLTTIFQWRPDKDPKFAEAVEAHLEQYMQLAAPQPVTVSACARLAVGFAEMAEAGIGPSGKAARAFQHWTDQACELLQELGDAPFDPSPDGEVIALIGFSVVIAFKDWGIRRDDSTFFDLAKRRYLQLRQVHRRVDDDDRALQELTDHIPGTVESAIIETCAQMMERFPEEVFDGDTWEAALQLRLLIHQLPEELWNRSGTTEEILLRISAEEPENVSRLQRYLDGLEVGLLRISQAGMYAAMQNLGTELRAETLPESDPDLVLGAWVVLTVIAPSPRLAYLTAAVVLDRDELPVDEVEGELEELLSGLDELEPSSPGFENLAAIRLASAVMKLESREWPEPELLRKEVWNLLNAYYRPIFRLDREMGVRSLAFLFMAVAGAAGGWSPEDLRVALNWFDDFEAFLAREGIDEPILALPRAEMAFALASRSHQEYAAVYTSSKTFVAHVENHPGLPDEMTAFPVRLLVRGLRLLALSEPVVIGLELMEADGDAAGPALRRLQELREDSGLEPPVQALAARYVSEVEMLQMVRSSEFSEIPYVPWEDLLDNRSVTFLMSLVEADESVLSAIDPSLIQQALARATAQTKELGVLGAPEARYLDVLTMKKARGRLGIDSRVARALAAAAAEVLDHTDPEAASIALAIAVNVSDLVEDPAVEADCRELLEEIAERFLPAALKKLPSGTILPRSLVALSSLAQNLGAVSTTEFFHRLRVTVAAHLLAVRARDIDLAALTAYLAAEFFRIAGLIDYAGHWFSLHDEWRTRGALTSSDHLDLQEAIDFDREQLRRAMGDETSRPTVAGSSLSDDYDARGRLAQLAFEVRGDPECPLDEGDAAALAGAAGLDLPPVFLLHQWNLALTFCAEASPTHPSRELLGEVTRKIASEMFARQLPEAVWRTAGLVALETLIEAAVAADDSELAREAVNRLAARLGELFLSADLGPRFLSLRPTAGNLRGAALSAFEKVDLATAIEVAETGRMKLLSSLASGRRHDVEELRPLGPKVQITSPELAAAINSPDLGTIERIVNSELDDDGLLAAVKGLTLPWVRLATSRGGTLIGNEIPDELWQGALIEPSLEWLFSTVENEMLIYPFIGKSFVGGAVLVPGAVFSFLQGLDEFPSTMPAAKLLMAIGSELKLAIRAHLDENGLARDEWDTRFVIWDAETEQAAQQLAAGFWVVPLLEEVTGRKLEESTPEVPILMPTARLLKGNPRRLAAPPETVSFVGDPTLDLPGPWVEAIAWAEAFGPRLQPHLGTAATKEATLAGLCESDLVVISGHTLGRAGDDSFGLHLANGSLSHLDLFELAGEVKASAAILSCCSAAAIAGSAKTEVMGLVTVLLALGVRQVLAPLVPIGDRPAGVIGAQLAAPIAGGCDLREALLTAGRRCLQPVQPKVSVQLPTPWIDVCPHSAATLQTRATADRGTLLDTLQVLGLFGEGR